jgi:hypothetical protein
MLLPKYVGKDQIIMKLWNHPPTLRSLFRSIKSSNRGCRGDALIPPYSAGGGGLGPVHSYQDLQQLVQWGLVDAQDDNKQSVQFNEINRDNAGDFTYNLSQNAIEIEDVLEINMTASPFFGRPPQEKDPAGLFMLMPFADELKVVFDTAVNKAASALKLKAARADASSSSRAIIAQVWSGIYHAKVIVADCTVLGNRTDVNANVLYEIGIAHTLGKETLLISQTPHILPFDIAHLRVIPYTNTPDGLAQLERELTSGLKIAMSVDELI